MVSVTASYNDKENEAVENGRTRPRRATALAAVLRIQGKLKPPETLCGESQEKERAAVSAAVCAAQGRTDTQFEDTPALDTSISRRNIGTKRTHAELAFAENSKVCSKRTRGINELDCVSTDTRGNSLSTIDEKGKRTSRKRPLHEAYRRTHTLNQSALGPDSLVLSEAGEERAHTVKDSNIPVGAGREDGQCDEVQAERNGNEDTTSSKLAKTASTSRPRQKCTPAAPYGKVAGNSMAVQSKPQLANKSKPRQPRFRVADLAAYKGKIIPAAVPSKWNAVPKNGTADQLQQNSSRAPAHQFTSGALPWTEAEIQRLHNVCSQVPPTALRYWQQVALHMPGRSATECCDKFQEYNTRTQRRPRAAVKKVTSIPAVTELQTNPQPKTECQKRKMQRKIRWMLQSVQQNSPHRTEAQMKEQKIADAYIDAFKSMRDDSKNVKKEIGLVTVMPKLVRFLASEDEPESSTHPAPQVISKASQLDSPQRLRAAFKTIDRAQDMLLASPDEIWPSYSSDEDA